MAMRISNKGFSLIEMCIVLFVISVFMMLLPTNIHIPDTEYYAFVDEYLYLQSTAMKQAQSVSYDIYNIRNKKGLFTAEAFVCLSVTLLLVAMMTSIVPVKYAQHAVFDRTIRKMEESLIETMNDVEGCLKECQIEKDSPS